jgi:dipeptidyl aminopeptidase/acylaminoacyl peptidase
MQVDLVNVTTQDGVRLDGIWRKPEIENESKLGVDVVLLMHGVGGNFYGAGMFEDYSDTLLERGCAVLRVNNRGHDPISRVTVGEEPKRFGGAYEVIDECRADWKAWVDFAISKGYKQIALWGHSLGATKSIYYMAQEHDSRVKCVVAGSPPRFSYTAFSKMAEGKEFEEMAAYTQKLIDDGQPDYLVDSLNPYPVLVTAEVWVQKYGPEEKYNILKHIPNVRVPLLVLIGTQEEIDLMTFRGSRQEIEQLEGELGNLEFESIPGADHSYTLNNSREYVWKLVSSWLEKV